MPFPRSTATNDSRTRWTRDNHGRLTNGEITIEILIPNGASVDPLYEWLTTALLEDEPERV